MQLAGTGRLIQSLLGTRLGKAMLAPATKEAAKAAVPGAVLSSAFTGLSGGGIPATAATGLLDMGLSTAGARLAGKVTPEMLSKVMPQRAARFIAGAKPGDMSPLQSVAMGLGSVSATMAAEPLYPSQELVGISPAQLQQLIAEPVVMDQTATAEQQLLQRDLINRLQGEALSPGTMFQMQGIESTLGRGMTVDPRIDPYGIMRG